MISNAAASDISELLFREDPIGINFETNDDEYDSEAADISRRLPEATSVDDLTRMIHEIFVEWFTASVAGSKSRYAKIAALIWEMAYSDQSVVDSKRGDVAPGVND